MGIKFTCHGPFYVLDSNCVFTCVICFIYEHCWEPEMLDLLATTAYVIVVLVVVQINLLNLEFEPRGHVTYDCCPSW